jgi:hypothetical protein
VDMVDWLLESEPAIRWQAMRDLTEAPAEAVAAERARVAREGLGREILARQDEDGGWRASDRGSGPGGRRVWLSTLFTLQLLRATGVDRRDAAVEAAVARLEAGLCWDDSEGGWELRRPAPGGRPYFEGEVEPCINGGVLALGGYFGRPAEGLARRLVGEQLGDGGWNCEAPKSMRPSFHTTICVLEGLLEFERAVGVGAAVSAGIVAEVAAARRRGEEYLLERGMFRRRSTGEVASAAFLELAFPPRYHYDVLRGLDYFRAAGAEPDARMGDAVSFVAGRREEEGWWRLDRAYDEALAVGTGESVGEASRWNTLRALRVLRWYEG